MFQNITNGKIKKQYINIFLCVFKALRSYLPSQLMQLSNTVYSCK
jgi:hypothetical protein